MSATIERSKRTIDEILVKWLEEWSVSGNSKLEWENFLNKYGPQKTIKMVSSVQHTEMTIQQKAPLKKDVETVVVWNGNGARARLTEKAELKLVVQAADPAVLCLLEGKTDAEHLLHISQFRDWATAAQYRQVNCHWSVREGKKAFGCEGIIYLARFPAR